MKAILVIDKPECCGECPLCVYEGIFVCNRTRKNVDKNKLYEDCPLKSMPKKMAIEERWYSKDFARGYNLCIDEILGGKEE